MKNFVQNGSTIPVTAPAGGVASGDGMLLGSLFGVASEDAAAGVTVEMATTGVYDLPKVSGLAVTAGAPIYWDQSDAAATPASASDAVLIGAAIEAAGGSAATVRTRLNGTAT